LQETGYIKTGKKKIKRVYYYKYKLELVKNFINNNYNKNVNY